MPRVSCNVGVCEDLQHRRLCRVDSGWRNHKVVTRPASSLAQDRESSPAETSVLPTMLRRQHVVRRTVAKCEQYIRLHATFVNRNRNGNVQSDTGYCTFTDTNAFISVLYCNYPEHRRHVPSSLRTSKSSRHWHIGSGIFITVINMPLAVCFFFFISLFITECCTQGLLPSRSKISVTG